MVEAKHRTQWKWLVECSSGQIQSQSFHLRSLMACFLRASRPAHEASPLCFDALLLLYLAFASIPSPNLLSPFFDILWRLGCSPNSTAAAVCLLGKRRGHGGAWRGNVGWVRGSKDVRADKISGKRLTGKRPAAGQDKQLASGRGLGAGYGFGGG